MPPSQKGPSARDFFQHKLQFMDTAIDTADPSKRAMNKGKLTLNGWRTLIAWFCQLYQELFSGTDSQVMKEILNLRFYDVGCGEGDPLLFAFNDGFRSVQGCEVDPATKFLHVLLEFRNQGKIAITCPQSAGDESFMSKILPTADFILWNGFLFDFQKNTGGDIGKVPFYFSRFCKPGTFILSNVLISDRFQTFFYQMGRQNFKNADIVSWSGNCDWYMYYCLPAPISFFNNDVQPALCFWRALKSSATIGKGSIKEVAADSRYPCDREEQARIWNNYILPLSTSSAAQRNHLPHEEDILHSGLSKRQRKPKTVWDPSDTDKTRNK